MERTAEGHQHSVLVISRCSRAFGMSLGGADVLANRHAVALARSGLSVVLVSGSSDMVLPGEGRVVSTPPTQFLVLRPRGGNLNPLFLLNEFVNIVRGTLRGLRILRSNRFDLVVTNHSISTLMVKLRHPTQATVHFIHDGLHAHRSVRHIPEKVVRFFLNDVLELMAARAADRDLCASNGIQSQLLGSGIPASKTVAIGPLVSSPPDQPPGPVDSNPEPVLRPPYLLSVGQQVGRKRFDVLIRAMKNVPSEISLVLVGDGPLHDSYAELAREENLTERVVFLNGVGEGQLDRLYAGAELFVLVSENEGFPISVAEARAKGRPVLFASPSVASWSGASDPGLTVMPFVPSAEDLGRKLTDVLATTEGKELGSSDWSPLPPAQPVLEHDVVALYDQFLAAG